MRSWVEKSVFKRHKTLFGYTDIGWTVKHPKQLIRALIIEEVWKLNPEDDSVSTKNNVMKSQKDQKRDDEGYEDLLEVAWKIREQSGK
ncbi:MAG: hypothetical protein GPJ54_10055 [Candidatus Heimdallarchaeota archaeon]|nr:hypothetical protein [Candidatus Heimdallarchaeota archaeon]